LERATKLIATNVAFSVLAILHYVAWVSGDLPARHAARVYVRG